jgi:hypothetical protein
MRLREILYPNDIRHLSTTSMKTEKMMLYANGDPKQAGMSVPLSDKVDFKNYKKRKIHWIMKQ